MSWNKKLKDWVTDQGISQLKFVDMLNEGQEKKISRNTLNDWIRGKNTYITKDSEYRISRLYEVTKLECFSPDYDPDTIKQEHKTTYKKNKGLVSPVEVESIDGLLTNFQNIEKEFRNLRTEVAKNTRNYKLLNENIPVNERANNVSNLFYMLVEELDFFKDSNEKERKQ